MSTFKTYKKSTWPVHPKKAILLIILMQTMFFIAMGQHIDSMSAISLQLNQNQAIFNATLRPLNQVAGAPEAFYSYYWEFGDGQFSFEEKPRHNYRDTGLYDTRLFATNNYDDGKPPPLKPKPVRVKSKNSSYAVNKSPSFFKQGGNLEMRVNCMPKPGEDMVLIIGYRNDKEATAMNGSMILFYNERQFKKNNFDFSEERTYHNEQKTLLSNLLAYNNPAPQYLPAGNLSGPGATTPWHEPGYYGGNLAELVAAKQQVFRQNQTWRFSNLEKGGEKYFFITLHTTPEMIKDTNAVVELSGMFVPDNPALDIEEYTLELQIVASHDPNRMMLKNRRLNYRFTGKKKEMTYTVRFQNTGRGPANRIAVGVTVPVMMDARSVELLDWYPKAALCDAGTRPGQSCLDSIIQKDSIYFLFNNIYLPGLRQQGFSDPDSTMGFIKYRMHFNKDLKKLPFESNAAIIFDNNKPIYTNSQRGYFKPGKSYGIIAGFNFSIDKNRKDENYISIGGSISPYAPHRKYLQAELYFGYLQLPEKLIDARTENKDTVINTTTFHIFQREIFARPKIVKLDIVPVQLRYNLCNWIGGGLGSMLSVDAYTKTNNRQVIYMQQVMPPAPGLIKMEGSSATTSWFTNIDVAAFADIQFGRVRVGPVLGARFIHYFRFPRNSLFAYLAWRL